MSKKLCIFSYLAIIHFTIFYLLLLGTILIFYKIHVNESKRICESTITTETPSPTSTVTTTTTTTLTTTCDQRGNSHNCH